MNNSERNISLIGKSGNEYYGKIYDDRSSDTSLSGEAVVCLSNSRWSNNHWQHNILDIYNDDAVYALKRFKERDDISHIIVLPLDELTEHQGTDIIDDLRRQYVHK
jgi:hypothetical protein